MKSPIIIIFLLTCSLVLMGQNPFQQEVNYLIKVTLNDEAHTLEGNISIEYTNNAPVDLTEILNVLLIS